MEFTVKLSINVDQLWELEMLQEAMQKSTDNPEYYTLEKVFEFVMELSSRKRINDAIENAAYHYDKYYDDYPYKYGIDRTSQIMEEEKATGKYIEHAYPNPRIVRD